MVYLMVSRHLTGAGILKTKINSIAFMDPPLLPFMMLPVLCPCLSEMPRQSRPLDFVSCSAIKTLGG